MGRGVQKRDVRGKVYLVTGGAMGMGKEVAKLFAADGARIVLWDINQEKLDEAAAEVRSLGAEVITDVVDVTDREQVYAAAERVKRSFGKVDILHNNAGVVKGGYFMDVEDDWHIKTMDVNFNAYMWTMKAFMPEMIAANDGHIINVASAAGLTYVPMLSTYCASKAAVVNFTDALRLEMKKLGKDGVRFTIICPSFVTTGMFEGVKAPLLVPWLSPERITRKIYEAYHRRSNIVMEPLMVKFVPLFRGAIPRPIYDVVSEVLGITRAMAHWKGR